jgi:hypothetical protein
MEDNTEKKRKDEKDTLHHLCNRSILKPVTIPDPADQEQKCCMNEDIDTGKRP